MGGWVQKEGSGTGVPERDRIQMFSRSGWAMEEPRLEGGLSEEMRHRVTEGSRHSRDTSKC